MIFGVSIHALLAESDALIPHQQKCGDGFLSTLSLRRATGGDSCYLDNIESFYPRSPCGERLSALGGTTMPEVCFYPRSPCGERQKPSTFAVTETMVSIHALLAESDVKFQLNFINQKKFLSTLSLRRATAGMVWDNRHFKFLSTLSLRRATLFCLDSS